MRENSTISARAFGNANGGNIDIGTEFIVASPNQNNDIIARIKFFQPNKLDWMRY